MIEAGGRRSFRWIGALAVTSAVVWSFFGAEFDPRALFSERAANGAKTFLLDCWPPRTDGEFLLRLARATLDTVAVSTVGTALAVLVGFPLGALSSRTVTHGAHFATEGRGGGVLAWIVFAIARTFGGIARSIPEIVWALLFVRVAGLGPMPAVMALGIAYGGLLGKVFAEQMEDVDPGPVAALEAAGAGRAAAFAWGVLPQAFGRMASYTAYRFECSLRASVLMGFVGAGGLGFQIQVSAGDYLFGEVVTETLFIVAVVVVVEQLSDVLRRWIG